MKKSFNSKNPQPLAARKRFGSGGFWRIAAFAACLFGIFPGIFPGFLPAAAGEERESAPPAAESAAAALESFRAGGPSYLSRAEAACLQIIPHQRLCRETAKAMSFSLPSEDGKSSKDYVPHDLRGMILACAAFEPLNRLACLESLARPEISAEGIKACGLFSSGGEALCLESLGSIPAQKIRLCSSERGHKPGIYINYKARQKWDPDKNQNEAESPGDSFFWGAAARRANWKKPTANDGLLPVSYTKENESFCLKMAASPEVSAEEIQACAAFNPGQQPDCLQKAAALDLDPEKTQACGFYEGEGGPAECLNMTHLTSHTPEEIFACSALENQKVCLHLAKTPAGGPAGVAPELREACQSLNDSQSCLNQIEESLVSAKEIKACGLLDSWAGQFVCLAEAATLHLSAEEIQACGLSGFSSRGQALCLEKAALPDLSAAEIKACGKYNSREEVLCLEMAGRPALTLEEIRACGAADLGDREAGFCLERALRPKLALEDIIKCGRLVGIDEAACLRKAQERFLLSAEEKEACEEHFEEEDSCLSAAGLFNPGLEKLRACGAFYDGAGETLCLKKAAAPSLTAEEIQGCGAADFSAGSEALCLEKARELSFDSEALAICGAFYFENEIPCLETISLAKNPEAKAGAKACAAYRGANEMACLALALKLGRGGSPAAPLAELRACGSLSFGAESERFCLDEARRRPLSLTKAQACAGAAASSQSACLRESANPGLSAEKIRACSGFPPEHQEACFDLAGGSAEIFPEKIQNCQKTGSALFCLREAENPRLSSYKILLCSFLPSDSEPADLERICLMEASRLSPKTITLCQKLFGGDLLPLCLKSGAEASLKKIKACGEINIADKKTCLESIPEADISVRKIQLCASLSGGDLEALCLKNAHRFELDEDLTACLEAKTEDEQKYCLQSQTWLPEILQNLPSLNIPESLGYDQKKPEGEKTR